MIWLRYPLSDISFGEGGICSIPACWHPAVTGYPLSLWIQSELDLSLSLFMLLEFCIRVSFILSLVVALIPKAPYFLYSAWSSTIPSRTALHESLLVRVVLLLHYRHTLVQL